MCISGKSSCFPSHKLYYSSSEILPETAQLCSVCSSLFVDVSAQWPCGSHRIVTEHKIFTNCGAVWQSRFLVWHEGAIAIAHVYNVPQRIFRKLYWKIHTMQSCTHTHTAHTTATIPNLTEFMHCKSCHMRGHRVKESFNPTQQQFARANYYLKVSSLAVLHEHKRQKTLELGAFVKSHLWIGETAIDSVSFVSFLNLTLFAIKLLFNWSSNYPWIYWRFNQKSIVIFAVPTRAHSLIQPPHKEKSIQMKILNTTTAKTKKNINVQSHGKSCKCYNSLFPYPRPPQTRSTVDHSSRCAQITVRLMWSMQTDASWQKKKSATIKAATYTTAWYCIHHVCESWKWEQFTYTHSRMVFHFAL